jgi:hypothetical protein
LAEITEPTFVRGLSTNACPSLADLEHHQWALRLDEAAGVENPFEAIPRILVRTRSNTKRQAVP